MADTTFAAANAAAAAAAKGGGGGDGLAGGALATTAANGWDQHKQILNEFNPPADPSLYLILRKAEVIRNAGICKPTTGGVDDEIDERNRLNAAISHSLDLFGLTTYEAAVASGHDKDAQRAKWKMMCTHLHPDSVHHLCKTHKIPQNRKSAVISMLNVAFSTLTMANRFVRGWMDSGGAGVVRTAVTDPELGGNKRTIVALDSDSECDEGKDISGRKQRRNSANANASENAIKNPLNPVRDGEGGAQAAGVVSEAESGVAADAVDGGEEKRGGALDGVPSYPDGGGSGSAVLPAESGHDNDVPQVPQPFFYPLDGAGQTAGPLEYIGRDTLACFGSLLNAGGLLLPRKWQELKPEHLIVINGFLCACLDELREGDLIGQTGILPLPVTIWKSILEGQPDPRLTEFMVDMVHNAVRSTRVTLLGLTTGNSSPFLKVDSTKLQNALLVGPDVVQEMRCSAISYELISRIMVDGVTGGGLVSPRALMMIDKSENKLFHLHCKSSKWTSTTYTGLKQCNVKIDERLRKVLASILKTSGRFQHTCESAPVDIKRESAAFGMFIQLVQVLTGETLSSDCWGLCVELQRPWWVLQLFREAERSGAIPAGWLRAQLEAEVKASAERIDNLLAKQLAESEGRAAKRAELEAQLGGAAAAADLIGPNMEEVGQPEVARQGGALGSTPVTARQESPGTPASGGGTSEDINSKPGPPSDSPGNSEPGSPCGGSPTADDVREADALLDQASRDSQDETRFRRSLSSEAVAPAAAAEAQTVAPVAAAPSTSPAVLGVVKAACQLSPTSPRPAPQKGGRPAKTMPADQPRMTTFFAPATCKSGAKGSHPRNDGNDDADSQPGPGTGTGTGTGPASSATSAGAAQASGSGDPKAGTGGTLAGQQLHAVTDMLKKAPRTVGLDLSVRLSAPGLKTRRNLCLAVLKARKNAASDATLSQILVQVIELVACHIVAASVLEAELTLGPSLRRHVRSHVSRLQELGVNEDTLRPIHDALAAAELPSPQDVPSASLTGSGSANSTAVVEKIPVLSGVSGMLQKALEACCMCWSAPGSACSGGHLRFCGPCKKALGIERSGGQCDCLASALSLMRRTCRRGNMAAKFTRQTLMEGRDHLVQATRLLVLAIMLDVCPVIDTLLNAVVEVVKAQLIERLLPSATAEQIAVLHGVHSDITPYLVQRVAQAHADHLREHTSYNGAPRLEAVTSPRHGRPRVGYLAGNLDNADLAHVLEQDTWLIIDARRSRAAWANDLVDQHAKTDHLLVLAGPR